MSQAGVAIDRTGEHGFGLEPEVLGTEISGLLAIDAMRQSERDTPRAESIRDVAAERCLSVAVDAVPARVRGTLSEFLSACIENELLAHGALPRSRSVLNQFSELLADQLYRARLLGLDQVRLALPSLAPIAEDGVLSGEDSHSLRCWLDASKTHALSIELSAEMESLRAFPEPVDFAEWLTPVQSETAENRAATIAQAMPCDVMRYDNVADQSNAEPMAEELDVANAGDAELDDLDLDAEDRDGVDFDAEDLDAVLLDDPPLVGEQLTIDDALCRQAAVKPLPAPLCEWCAALEDAQGALSWEALETLFVTAYCPLQSALLEHGEHPEARRVLERWSREFSTSYSVAFERLKCRRARPTMVFDAPRIGFQLAREHSAKSMKLVLIDACRWDIAERAQEKLRLQLSGHAECVERGILWAPVPATTGAGLELLARGPEALSSFTGQLQEADVVSRSESRKLRPLRAGGHSLLKLDAIQSVLPGDGDWTGADLDQLAAEVAVSCGRFIRQQPKGALVLLFGDHGFRLNDGGHGGSSPEETLVGYQAWRTLGDGIG